jgi:hypothetical protein
MPLGQAPHTTPGPLYCNSPRILYRYPPRAMGLENCVFAVFNMGLKLPWSSAPALHCRLLPPPPASPPSEVLASRGVAVPGRLAPALSPLTRFSNPQPNNSPDPAAVAGRAAPTQPCSLTVPPTWAGTGAVVLSQNSSSLSYSSSSISASISSSLLV